MKEMTVKLEEIFKEKSLIKRGIPSVKVISGIIGKCWISPCKNREIATEIGVSDGVISEAINNHLKKSNVIIIEPDKELKRFNNTVNFEGLIDYFAELVKHEFKGDKKEIVQVVRRNRTAVGKSFLASFVGNQAYSRGLSKVRKLYQTIPELLFLLVLSLDASAPNNGTYLHFLRCIYKAIMLKAQDEYPELVYVWSGMTWFMMEFEDEK